MASIGLFFWKNLKNETYWYDWFQQKLFLSLDMQGIHGPVMAKGAIIATLWWIYQWIILPHTIYYYMILSLNFLIIEYIIYVSMFHEVITPWRACTVLTDFYDKKDWDDYIK